MKGEVQRFVFSALKTQFLTLKAPLSTSIILHGRKTESFESSDISIKIRISNQINTGFFYEWLSREMKINGRVIK